MLSTDGESKKKLLEFREILLSLNDQTIGAHDKEHNYKKKKTKNVINNI